MIRLQKRRTTYPNPHDYGRWRACPGVSASGQLGPIRREQNRDMERYNNRLPYCTRTDLAWVVCLHHAGVIDSETAKPLIEGLQTLLAQDEPGSGGEPSLIPVLEDEDLASLINLGRTMQEPMSRLQMRDQMLDFFEHYLEQMALMADMAAAHTETIMPGHTHFSQANPITLASYLLSVFDNLHRGLEQLELSYSLINRNSGGCGATSGTAWPVDRQYLTQLLGFDQLLEVTYDCEASQDHTMHLMFSLANFANTLGKVTMDVEIWGLEEIDMIRTDPRFAGVSSMMPQKSHNGQMPENLRNDICDLLGLAVVGLFRTKAEPHGDVLAMWSFPQKGIEALARAKSIVRTFGVLLGALQPQKETMLEHVRDGYSCMTEVVVHLVGEKGYGGRRAHRICAHLVRLARERGIKAPELTGAMLDEAARLCQEDPPGMDTPTLQRCLDPVAFISTHGHTGGPAPAETERMVGKRKAVISEARARLAERRGRVAAGEELLSKEIAAICGRVAAAAC